MELERAVIEVFGGCNYSCAMCPQSTDEGRGKNWTRKMPLAMFEEILDQLPGKPIINLEGSGEPTMAKDLPAYISACSSRGLKTFMFTNGARFKGQFMRDCIDAGLSFVRFSVIGHSSANYRKWMGNNNFRMVAQNIKEAKEYVKESGADCQLSTYHLITDLDNERLETSFYRSFVDELGVYGYIWKMHNWSGNYDPKYHRTAPQKKSCGRPFANEITIRAGGLGNQRGAVTPCCQTMGPPNEDKSVLGHFQSQTFEEIWFGEEYNKLRKAHEMGDWPEYCKDCDFLIDDPEVLIWSNDPEAKVHGMLGTKIDLRKI